MFLKHLISKSIFRYLAVVAGAYCADFALYVLIVHAGWSVYLANLVGFTFGTTLSVIFIRRYALPHSRFELLPDIALTILANGTTIVASMVFLWIFVGYLNMNPYLAKVVANGSTFLINYMARVMFFTAR